MRNVFRYLYGVGRVGRVSLWKGWEENLLGVMVEGGVLGLGKDKVGGCEKRLVGSRGFEVWRWKVGEVNCENLGEGWKWC